VDPACPNSRRFDAILAENWDLMEAHAGAKLMPKPARRGPHAHRTLGCGWNGCVYETGKRNVVLKVTQDASEPAFVLAVRKRRGLGWWPDGFVQYQDVVQLRGSGDSTFALWRERAYNVGALGRQYRSLPAKYRRRWSEDEVQFFDDLLYAHMRSTLEVSLGHRVRSSTELRRILDSFQREIRRKKPLPSGSPGYWDWKNVINSAYDLGVSGPGKFLGASLASLAEGFIVPTDLTPNNLGDCPRGSSFAIVVTDPGRWVPLHPDLLEVEVPLL
jgi:hypothetical protein